MGLRRVDSQEGRAQPCLQEKLPHTVQGSEEVWSLADTAVKMQIQWGKQYSQQQHFLPFQEGGGVFWRWNKLNLQKPITILSALESFLSAHQPMGKLAENLAQGKG